MFSLIPALFIIGIAKWFFPNLIPLDLFYWEDNKSSLVEILKSSYPVFLFGLVYTSLALLLTKNPPEQNRNAEKKFILGILISFWAGITEEIAFRWILFLSAIATIQILDWVLGGFLFGNGLTYLIYTNVLIPVADWATFRQLTEYLYNPSGWAIGAAILSTNGQFRDGHAYQGLIGWINAWFFGMFMYKVVWECGLPCGILVHVVYDIIIFSLVFIDRKVEYFRGNR